MYGRPVPATASVLPEASEDRGIRQRRERLQVLDVHEERANRPDPLEVLGHLVRGTGQRRVAGAVELLGEEHVLGNLDRVLQQPVDEDHVDPDELAPVPDGLGGHLADVRDELQLQVVRLGAPVAGAQVGRDVLPLDDGTPGAWPSRPGGSAATVASPSDASA